MTKTNIGGYILPKYGVKHLGAGTNGAIVAGGTYDNVEATTQVIDRKGFDSCEVALFYQGAIATGESLTHGLKISDSADNGTWNTEAVIYAATTIVTLTTGATIYGVYTKDIDLTGYERYIKFLSTGNLSASGTDTIFLHTHVILGGAQALPTAGNGTVPRVA
jgi:hypothetical protein